MSAQLTFQERLDAVADDFGRLCVGADPQPSVLDAWGLADTPAGVREFSERFADAFAGRVALVKPQVAFFERFGAAGFAVLEELIAALRAAGTLVLADAKRGDIGSTMAGYAAAWLGPGSPVACDAVTVSPYLGVGALEPAATAADTALGGVFVLAATSNPQALDVQQTPGVDGLTLAQKVADDTAALADTYPRATLGLVVGATLDRLHVPSLGAFSGPILMPGVGAQGASIAGALELAGSARNRAWPAVSRAILRAGPDLEALRRAAESFTV
ncbi:orotidine-5'-phosphate decarboxylase [Corynebacterium atypicum]|uniref:orotidine-5'-phosphate decarboxylase n=1 Tax=Corynebacterium atypicum TaxID=191610 RepID=UPI000AAFE654|nr:orotidine-5'-phosphate decarboxylase [Corynebacterium atypicum]